MTDVRYETRAGFTRIALFLNRPVGGINHDSIPAREGFPPRVYLDLTPCKPLSKWSRRARWVGDKRVGRIRIARNTLQTTRVVLELQQNFSYKVHILRNPMRIYIDIGRRLPARMARFTPKLQPKPWVSRYRRRPRKSTKRLPSVIRHRGPLPRIPFPFRVSRIMIDAGHGGREDGAVGPRSGMLEKDITLDLSRRVARMIKRRFPKIRVYMTRRKDKQVSLSSRAAMIQRKGIDLLISIHINAHTSRKVHGLSTYILDWNSRSFAARLLSSDPLTARENQGVDPRRFGTVGSILASLKRQSNLTVSRILGIAVQRAMLRGARKLYPKAKDLGVRKGLFYLLFAAQVPGVLVEASYLTNAKEERRLKRSRYRQALAKGIVKGLGRFLREARRSLKRKSARRRRR